MSALSVTVRGGGSCEYDSSNQEVIVGVNVKVVTLLAAVNASDMC